jgi:hypothetical protein
MCACVRRAGLRYLPPKATCDWYRRANSGDEGVHGDEGEKFKEAREFRESFFKTED